MKILSINELSLISGGADYADYLPSKETIKENIGYAAAATMSMLIACALAYTLKLQTISYASL